MNNTIWQVIGAIIGLVVLAIALTLVSDTLNRPQQTCEDGCDFVGYRCGTDGGVIFSEICQDKDFDACKEYDVEVCTTSCDPETGRCT